MTKAERTLLVAIARALVSPAPQTRVELQAAIHAVALQTLRKQREAAERKRAAAWQDQL
jgi:hypothetical protein